MITTLSRGFQTRASLLAEILALRHQLAILKRSSKKRHRPGKPDRFLRLWLRYWLPDWRNCLLIVKPHFVLSWHRKGFRLFWTWKSRRRRPGRADATQEIRDLIRKMSTANATWGAPRIHGELLKLGIEVSQATVAKYMIRRGKPPSQTWRTFLENHVKEMVSVDFLEERGAAINQLMQLALPGCECRPLWDATFFPPFTLQIVAHHTLTRFSARA